jgi:hypothetical protein
LSDDNRDAQYGACLSAVSGGFNLPETLSDLMLSPHGRKRSGFFGTLPVEAKQRVCPGFENKTPNAAMGAAPSGVCCASTSTMAAVAGRAPRNRRLSSRSKANQRSSTPSRGRIHSNTNGRAKNARRFAGRRNERRANPGDPRHVRRESHRVQRESRYVRSCLPARPRRHKQRAGPPASAVCRQSRQQERVCVSSSFPYRNDQTNTLLSCTAAEPDLNTDRYPWNQLNFGNGLIVSTWLSTVDVPKMLTGCSSIVRYANTRTAVRPSGGRCHPRDVKAILLFMSGLGVLILVG